MFFNTNIPTYIWILSNKKKSNRKGKIQLIKGEDLYESINRNFGKKNRVINDEHINFLLKTYLDFKENNLCKILNSEDFGFKKITIEQPLLENGKEKKNKKGELIPNPKLRDYERVGLNEDIKEYFEKEVKSNLKNSWVDHSKTLTGYEISFNKVFYKPDQNKSIDEIINELNLIDQKIKNEIEDI